MVFALPPVTLVYTPPVGLLVDIPCGTGLETSTFTDAVLVFLEVAQKLTILG